MSILKSLKLTFPLLLSCTLLLSNGGTVFAEGSQNGDMEPTSEISSQSTSVIKMSLDPELNKKFAEQQGYGLIPLSEHPDFSLILKLMPPLNINLYKQLLEVEQLLEQNPMQFTKCISL